MDRPLLESVIEELERIDRSFIARSDTLTTEGRDRLRELRLRLDREQLKLALAGPVSR